MALVDDELTAELKMLMEYLGKENPEPEDWFPQVNLGYGKKTILNVISTGLGDDPIECLVQFGRALKRNKQSQGLQTITVIVEFKGALMVCTADEASNIALGYITRSKNKWKLAEKHASADNGDLSRQGDPAVAVWRGIKGKRAH
jgi:hypothetical protein